MPSEADPAERLSRGIRLLSLRHRARIGALLAPMHLFPGQEYVLLTLEEQGPVIQAKLAQAVGCEPPVLTQTLRKLESAGLVRRWADPDDGRAQVVELTAEGRARCDRVHEAWATLGTDTADGLSVADLEAATALVERMVRNLEDAAGRA